MNDNIKISKLLKRIISIYSKNIKKIKLDTLNKWRKNILIISKKKINKKHKLNIVIHFVPKVQIVLIDYMKIINIKKVI